MGTCMKWLRRWIYLILLIDLHRGHAKKKKVLINFTSDIIVCDDPESKSFIDTNDLKAIRINETTTKLEGGFSYKREFANLLKFHIMIERVAASGSSEVIFTTEIKDLCAEYAKRYEDSLAAPYMRTMNMPDCPVPAGDYRIDNMFVDMSQIPKEAILQGVYKISFTFYSYEEDGVGLYALTKDTKLACLSLECTVESA